VGTGYATARPPEGDARRKRVGAGVEWRGQDTEAQASAWSNGGDVSKTGAALSAAWSPDDFWSVSADYERYSWETPLRAVLHGITADGGGLGVGYAWNESRALWTGVRAHEFTDGNQRRQIRFAWAERVLEQPSMSVTLRPELYASRNSLANAPYFNPSHDLAVSLAADVQDVLWRRYEDSWRHRILVRAGRYHQEGFDDGWVGGVGYEQAWQRARFELRWGLELGRARYDGAGENYGVLFVAGSGRF
jgi:biofilm PGA synthesis protein PgaA